MATLLVERGAVPYLRHILVVAVRDLAFHPGGPSPGRWYPRRHLRDPHLALGGSLAYSTLPGGSYSAGLQR